MNIERIHITICDNEQSHFNYGIFIITHVLFGELFNNTDIILDSELVKDIDLLCKVLSHEIEHILLFELFDDVTSTLYDNILNDG